ncbi:MAG: hypothetical protein ACI9VS_004515, partial [Candidatus Binatia bacterium]
MVLEPSSCVSAGFSGGKKGWIVLSCAESDFSKSISNRNFRKTIMKQRLSLMFAAASAAFAIGVSSATAGAFDWPQWRGPDRNDVSKETGLLKRWPTGGPK